MIKLTKTLMGFAFFAPYSLLLATQKQEINLNQNPTSLSKTNHYNHSHTLCSKIGDTTMPRESASYRATPNRSYSVNEFKISLSIEKKDFSDDSKHDDNQVKHGMGYVERPKEIYIDDDLGVLAPDNKDGGFKGIFGDTAPNLERASYDKKKKMGQNQDLQITSNAQRRVLDKVKQRQKKVKKIR